MARRKKSTPLQAVIFDTDILIWYFRGNNQARSFLVNTPTEHRWITSLNLMELLQGAQNRSEILEIQSFVAQNISRILHPRTSVSEKAIHLVGEYAVSHGLRVIDSLVAASALLYRARLATANHRYFGCIPGLSLIPFHLS